jgi:hypothetical protein
MMKLVGILLAAVALISTPGALSDALAESVVPVEGRWSGATEAGQPVSFEVKEGQVVNARFRFRWGFCETFESAEPKSVGIDPSGHWKYLDTRGPWMEGTFGGVDHLEGVVVAPERSFPSCPEAEVSFQAAPGEPGSAGKPTVRAVFDRVTGALAKRPHEIVPFESFPFERNPFYLYALRWKSFGGSVARATGRAYTRRDFEYRDGSEVKRRRVTLRLSHLVRIGDNLVYARLQYVLRGPVANGFTRRRSVLMFR